MNESDIYKLAQILAINAEILGMQAENDQRKACGESMAYTNNDFCYMANDLRKVVEK